MNLYKKIKAVYSSLATKIYQLTSKRAVMDLSAFYDTPMMTKSHHIVTALRYVAIEERYGENDFGKSLYITANHFENAAAMQKDLDNFDALIKSIETKGYDMNSVIYVDLNGTCFNGTHRLALCVWFGIEKIPVYIVKRHLKTQTIQEMREYYQLSEQDYERLESAYQRMRERLLGN